MCTRSRSCREQVGLSDDIWAQAGNPAVIYKAAGCPACQGTGYLGRTGIYELMLVDDEVRRLILARVDANSIKSKARDNGMITLQSDGTDKVLAGITTTEEVSRVTQEDSMSLDAFG